MNIFLGVGAVVALITLLVVRDSTRKAKRVEAAFAGRESLRPEQFYERYFMEKGFPLHVVSGVRATLEEELQADMSRLTDADDFSKNLSFFWDYDSMANMEIVCSLEKRFAIEIGIKEGWPSPCRLTSPSTRTPKAVSRLRRAVPWSPVTSDVIERR